MIDARELYQELILDHNRSPKNFRVIETSTAKSKGYNPLCGDHYTVYVELDGGRISDVSFQGAGCAISKASASLMTQHVKGKTIPEALSAVEKFQSLVTGQAEASEALGSLNAFESLKNFPMRVKCATLSWHALKAATQGETEVTTE